MIRVVSCGVGNIRAFLNAYKALGVNAGVATTAAELQDATHIVLPGVGSFDSAMTSLGNSGLKGVLEELALVKRLPILSICVGMQMLGKRSDEGSQPGLGWIDASVEKFSAEDAGKPLLLPHMGWNDVRVERSSELFKGMESEARFYFLHSYKVVPHSADLVLASADYGGSFTCAVQQDNLFGVQFHPEKSHQWGERLLHNFSRL